MNIHIPPQEKSNYKQLLFAAGENHVQVFEKDEVANLFYSYTGDNSILILLQLTDAVRRNGAKEVNLFIPYFPGARQDRVCNEGEALSVKVYANLINSQKYDKVVIFDPHSEVTPALIENCKVVKNHEFVKHTLRDIETIYRDALMEEEIIKCEYTGEEYLDGKVYNNIQGIKTPLVLVSPDAGAGKKVSELSKYLGEIEVIRADKTRNVKTGKLSDCIVYTDNLEGKIAIIPDDIISYGGTFKALAKELKIKGANKVYLIVSHYEGVSNLRELKESGIDWIFTTNSLSRAESQDNLTVYDIWRFMN